jgi:hypothetical protein
MPDDVIEEEIAEQEEPDTEGEAGFDEFADGEPETDETEGEPVDEKLEGDEEPEGEEKPEGETDEKSEEKEEEPADDKDLSAKETIDARVKELETDEKPDEKPAVIAADKPGEAEKVDQVGPPADQPPGEQQPPVKTRLTKEQLSQHLAVISDDELPEGEVTIGDSTFNFKELREDDPEVYNAMKVMSSIAGAKYLNAAVQSGKLVTVDAVKELKAEVENVRDLLNFSTEMTSRGHGDFLGIIHSDKYQKWIEGESEGVKMLASSSDPDDSVKVLNYYKESVGKAKVSDHDKAAKDKHSRKNDLLKGTKTTKPAGPAKKKTDENDDEAAFNEHADD